LKKAGSAEKACSKARSILQFRSPTHSPEEPNAELAELTSGKKPKLEIGCGVRLPKAKREIGSLANAGP